LLIAAECSLGAKPRPNIYQIQATSVLSAEAMPPAP
jgi:hypothetical protein